MRIISGKLKGAKLFLPKDKSTRPLKDLVKESIFNLLDHSKKMKKKFRKFLNFRFIFWFRFFWTGVSLKRL